jgi:hypothetical protein
MNNIMHFEDIWNAAEATGAKLPDATCEEIISLIKNRLDKFVSDPILPREQAIIVGEVLFDICRLTHKQNINSAAALMLAANNRMQQNVQKDIKVDMP